MLTRMPPQANLLAKEQYSIVYTTSNYVLLFSPPGQGNSKKRGNVLVLLPRRYTDDNKRIDYDDTSDDYKEKIKNYVDDNGDVIGVVYAENPYEEDSGTITIPKVCNAHL